MRKKFLPILLSFFLAGCLSWSSPEELDRLVKEDPDFRQMITQRDQVHNQVKLIKDDLLAKKRAMDAEVEKMRNTYDAQSKEADQKIEKLEALIAVHRSTLKKELDIAEQESAAKVAELKELMGTYNDIKRVSKSKGINFTLKDKQVFREHVLELSEKINRLNERVQELRLQIRLKKQKIYFLK